MLVHEGKFKSPLAHHRYADGAQPTSPKPPSRTCAELLIAGLTAEQVRHWLHQQQRNLDALAQQLAAAAAALTYQPASS